MARSNAFRDGKVHVLSEMCATCVFRPGNKMELHPGRLKDLVDQNLKADTALVCHSTIMYEEKRDAVCRGFFDKYNTTPLQMAVRLDVVEYQDPPVEDDNG